MNPILVQTISDYFRDKKINKAYLFGSFAKGLEKDTSDIDILVELSESIGFMKLIQYKLDLEDQLHRNVDLVTPASISPLIFPLIQKDWKLIYERKR
ncbi:MAG TPA: nucleotidyltransferase domain-containing protein [Leptospiraceae bacterium]|nr:nucleotidyltransferase domain-containing protein [Leptospiraceae bacterium]HRG76151.1 nucleotidyltransferase domain-containing protein [Leptospiraceae bacterium]